jgi:hypothetical protein
LFSLLSGSPRIESVALRDVVVELPDSAQSHVGGALDLGGVSEQIAQAIETASLVSQLTIAEMVVRRRSAAGLIDIGRLEQLRIVPTRDPRPVGLEVELRVRSAAQVLELTGVLGVDGGTGAIGLSELAVTAGPAVATGAVTAHFSTGTTRVQAVFEELVVEVPESGQDDSKGGAPDDFRTIPLRLPIELPTGIQVDAAITRLRLRSGAEVFVFQDVSARWADEQLAVRLPAVDAAGGRGSIEWQATPAQTLPTQKLMVDLDRVDSGRLNRFLQRPPLIQTQFRLQIELDGPGATVGEWLANAEGYVRWLSEDGRFADELRDLVKVIDSAVGGVTSLAGAAADDEQALGEVTCTAGNFAIGSGVAKAEVLVAQTRHAVIRGSGSVSMTDGTLALELVPQPKSATLSVGVPVRLSGSMAAPEVAPDEMSLVKQVGAAAGLILFPPAGIAALTSLGSDATSCVETLDGANAPSSADGARDESQSKKSIGQTIDEATSSAIEEAGRVGDSIGGAIKRLFGN